MRTELLLALFIILLTITGPAMGQSSETPARKQAVAVQVPPGSVRIDGQLNEEIWNRAPPVIDFVQAEPEESAVPTDAMEVRFVYDDDALFVGARMYSRSPSDIQAPMSRRDENIRQAEHIFVSLDTYLDRRTAYTFGVTAAGVRFAHYHANDNRSGSDSGFDPVWEARVSVDSQGWLAELRIPFNQLRFTAGDTQVWGLNIYRTVPSRNEQVYWALVRRTDRVWASRFGELRGIVGTRPTRRLEVLPYVASSSTVTGSRDRNNPFDDGRNLEGRTGIDLKVGLGPNITFDGTINPDFGQVEGDPAEVNLSAFETFFSERRPFFVEGSRLLGGAAARQPWEGGGDGQYFYSRRIGARPVGPASGDFIDYPATSTILGAAKITGRLSTGTSVGILSAATADEFARTFDIQTTSLNRGKVAPRTVYNVGRIQQEFGQAGSTAGFMVTTVHRDMAAGDPLTSLMTRRAFSASGDSLLRFKDGEYEVGMNLGLSRVAGDAPAIARVQRSSARYFQRPDVHHVQYDPARVSMTGVKGGLSAERTSGRRWLWQASTEFVSPEFEVNDIGRLSTADRISGSAEIQYRETQPGRLFRNYAIGFEHEREWNFGGDLRGASLQSETEVTWRNFWTTAFNLDYDFAAQDQRLTRGGPTMGTPRGWSTAVRASNSWAANTRYFLRLEYRGNEDGGFAYDMNAGVTLRPTARWQLTLGPTYERRLDDRQYVTTLEEGRSETYGRRYIFAFVDRSTISSEIRLNYAFKPDITLEFYGEPFAASGRYYDFGELTAPGSRARRIYSAPAAQYQPGGSLVVTDGTSRFTLRNRDFNVVSFRSNVVLRWEWRPGSTLYMVWQQDRQESHAQGDRVGPRDLFGSFGASGNNVVAIKTTFWLGVR
jgi:hypothetical protein